MEKLNGAGSRGEWESDARLIIWVRRRPPRTVPLVKHVQEPNTTLLQHKKPQEIRSSTRTAKEDDGWQLTTQRLHAIELKLHSSLPNNPDNPVGYKPRNSTTSPPRNFTIWREQNNDPRTNSEALPGSKQLRNKRLVEDIAQPNSKAEKLYLEYREWYLPTEPLDQTNSTTPITTEPPSQKNEKNLSL